MEPTVQQTIETLGLEQVYEPVPHVHLLSNGRYTTLLTGAGAGYAGFDGLALTRWAADRTREADGFFIYLRDLDRGTVWSAGHQPVQTPPEAYEVAFGAGTAAFVRRDDGLETRMDVCVSPEDDVELRRLMVTNHSEATRRVALTSYAEAVLHPADADAAHPAFAKLFVQTEYLPAYRALLARRRPRGADERPVWMVHMLALETPPGPDDALRYETDRARFLGRGRTPAAPRALDPGQTLSNTTGNVLDPVVSFRHVLTLAPGASATVAFGLGGAWTRETATMLANRYGDPAAVDHAFERAARRARAEMKRMALSERHLRYFGKLTAALTYGDPRLRAPEALLRRSQGTRADLGRYGLPADAPLVLLRLADEDGLKALRTLLKAYTFWRRAGLVVNLLILNDRSSDEAEALHTAIRRLVRDFADEAEEMRTRTGADFEERILLAYADDLTPEGQWLAQNVAHIVVQGGALPELTYADAAAPRPVPHFEPAPPAAADGTATDAAAEDLRFFNGYGGFSPDGREYVLRLAPDEAGRLRLPPLPWSNTIANESAGFLATERGAGYTWSVNSRENRLTPWHNDPVTDPHGEALYLRDEAAGVYWSPTPGPVPGPGAYEVRHGFGYTRYRHHSHGLEQEVCQFMPRHGPVKLVRVQLTNRSDRPRRLALFRYQQWVLGVQPEANGRFVTTDYDDERGALLARNPYNDEFAHRVAFASVVAPEAAEPVGFTADRTAFLGRHGSPARPAALGSAAALDGRTGAGLDPCAAFQVSVELAPGETKTCCFVLGEAMNAEVAQMLLHRFGTPAAVDEALAGVQAFWQETLSGIHLQTPAPEIDLMVNGWLAYQNLSCRLWGRSAYYQSGGAFGFRDQLQDAAALVYLLPALTRHQLVLHAGHQFVEGDVMHWWHPPTSKGIRTRFSDDLLWLPYLTAFYIRTTGDATVLDDRTRFVRARALAEGEDEAFLTPETADEHGSIYEHCCRALDRALTAGAHGLPLMGTGDWNDGMNRVGREGRGESVWLGFFLFRILGDFIPLCEARGDDARAERYAAYRARLQEALETAGWDGQWYRRAYYDDGTPLGTAQGDECRIDALVQAWAVLSRAAPPERAAQALDALEEHLISEEDGLIRLLTPAFDRTPHDPGYIKGYLPGVRENGGQYTHAALWAVRALAEAGRGDRAGHLLAMLSPIRHARTQEEADVYQVEPYVIAADVYGVAPHVGRGGWTWYTGSAGWMYRVALESICGLQPAGDTLLLDPCIPRDWPGFTLRYRLPGSTTTYEIEVRNPDGVPHGVAAATLDGTPAPVEDARARLPLTDDGGTHRATVTLGA